MGNKQMISKSSNILFNYILIYVIYAKFVMCSNGNEIKQLLEYNTF